MSKTVYFVRHAKSSWDNVSLRDHDRPLNKRGLRDAPLMAEKLSEMGISLEQIVSSTATRAKETAIFFHKTFGLDVDNFHLEGNLYHGNVEDYLDGIRTWADDTYASAALFAHNPGMTYLANLFADSHVDNVPTCGISRIDFDVESFSDITRHNGRLVAFYYPKMFL